MTDKELTDLKKLLRNFVELYIVKTSTLISSHKKDIERFRETRSIAEEELEEELSKQQEEAKNQHGTWWVDAYKKYISQSTNLNDHEHINDLIIQYSEEKKAILEKCEQEIVRLEKKSTDFFAMNESNIKVFKQRHFAESQEFFELFSHHLQDLLNHPLMTKEYEESLKVFRMTVLKDLFTSALIDP